MRVKRNATKLKPRGRPFVAGDPRVNRHGQTKAATVELSTLLKKYLTEKGEELIDVEMPDGTIVKKTRAEVYALKIWNHAIEDGNFQFFQFLADRIMGKVKDQVELSGSLNQMTPEELRALAASRGIEVIK